MLGNNDIYDNQSVAAYGHLDYRFSDAFDMSLGARFSWDDRRTNDLRPFGSGVGTLKDGRFTFDAAVNYHIDQIKMVYVKYAQGYTSGGIDSNIRFRPEINDQLEGGFKTEFWNRRIRLNAAGYYSWVKDRQSTVPNTSAGAACSPVLIAAGFVPGSCPVGLFVYNLPGTTKIAGFEVESTIAPLEGLTLTANYSLNNPEFTTGERPARRHTFSFSAPYDAPKFDNGMYVSLRFDGGYRGKYHATGGNVASAYVGSVPAILVTDSAMTNISRV